MKKLISILSFLLIASCVNCKMVRNDAEVQFLQKMLNRAKSSFMQNDSSAIIVRDLGWAERVLSDGNIPEHDIQLVFKLVNEVSDVSSVQYPCIGTNSEENLTATVVVEHEQLDSALIYAKIKGVDAIYLQLLDNYTDYMKKAKFSCICVVKDKERYIVNATIFVPRKHFIIDEEKLMENLNKLWELENQTDSINTEKAETPAEQE